MRGSQETYLGGVSDVITRLRSSAVNKKIVFVVGQNVMKLPLVGEIISSIPTEMLVKVIAINSRLPEFHEVRRSGPILIIAIGGGKTIDSGKILSLSLEKSEFERCVEQRSFNLPRRDELIVIPTIAGSGSEATHFAVYYDDRGNKHSFAHSTVKPDVVLFCPELLSTLPKRVVLVSALDAVSHSIESFFSKRANHVSRRLARNALIECLPTLAQLQTKEVGPEQLRRLQIGAYLAGRSINIAQTNLPHALSYSLTKKHGIEHGLAVSLLLENYFLFLT